jgi:sugar lactone lactonase YvrE
LFLDTQSGLSVSRKLKVREGCLGIDHHNGTLAVSFYDPPAIQVLDMNGHILHQIIDTTVLKYPRYVSLSNNKERMYVSDWENEAVYEFTREGHLTKTIKNEEMGRPAGMTVTDGDYVVVCYPNKSDKVGVIVPRTREMQYIYLQDVGRPVSILIVEDKGKLFISERFDSENCSVIKMLDFKKT